MIKVEMKEGVFETLEISGIVVEISADIFLIVHTIYEKLQDINPKKAELLKKIFLNNQSIIFKEKEEIIEDSKNKLECLKGETDNETLKKIASKIEELNDMIENL